MKDKHLHAVIGLICCVIFFLSSLLLNSDFRKWLFMLDMGRYVGELVVFLCGIISCVALPLIAKSFGETKKQRMMLLLTAIGAELFLVGLFFTQIVLLIGVLLMIAALSIGAVKR